MTELDGRVALVTGAGRNIGRAIALDLAEAGAAVVVNARSNHAEADAVAKEIVEAGGKAFAHLADVTDAEAVKRLVDAATSRFGRLEIGAGGRLLRFIEKDPNAAGTAWINGGIYAFSPTLLAQLAASTGPSIERDFLSALPEATLHAAKRQAPFIDIGTPTSLAEAPAFFKEDKPS